MSFSKKTVKVLVKTAAVFMCFAAVAALPSCSAIFEDDDPEESSSYESATKAGSDKSSSDETSDTEPGMGYDRISNAYIYCAWYDVEKDNPAEYNEMDSEDAYALKCVFYFNEPVTGSFKAVLKRDGKQVAVKKIRLDGKVVAECDFSAGLEGIATFEAGTYNICLETGGKNIAASSDMRVD